MAPKLCHICYKVDPKLSQFSFLKSHRIYYILFSCKGILAKCNHFLKSKDQRKSLGSSREAVGKRVLHSLGINRLKESERLKHIFQMRHQEECWRAFVIAPPPRASSCSWHEEVQLLFKVDLVFTSLNSAFPRQQYSLLKY